MRLLSQRNPLWADKLLGASKLTIGRFGCTTTCISMLSEYFGKPVSPLQLASNANNYTIDGLIIWKNLHIPGMKFVERIYTRDDAKIREALKNPLKAVILEVNNKSHWVVGIKPALIGASYIVADPWDATKCDVIKRYHNITGAAIFARN